MGVVVNRVNATRLRRLPSDAEFCSWLTAIPDLPDNCIVDVRIVTPHEIRALNRSYRNIDRETNVLAFSSEFPAHVGYALLGDLVICADVVRREAADQGKNEEAHWAHLTIHGALHLLGHDHCDEQRAVEMESLETQILVELGHPCPYQNSMARIEA